MEQKGRRVEGMFQVAEQRGRLVDHASCRPLRDDVWMHRLPGRSRGINMEQSRSVFSLPPEERLPEPRQVHGSQVGCQQVEWGAGHEQ